MSTPDHRLRRATLAVMFAAVLAGALPAQAGTVRESRSFGAVAAEAAGNVWTGAQDVAIYALGLIGVQYRFGGNSPESGLDCSGLVRYVFQEVTGVTLPRTSREMSALGAKVPVEDLKIGDLVFFNTRRFQYSHVGIYLGDDNFIHAPSRGSQVQVAQLSGAYWRRHFNGARRLVGVLPAMVPAFISPAAANEPGDHIPMEAPTP